MDEPCVDDLLRGPMDEPRIAEYILECVDIPHNAGGPVCDPQTYYSQVQLQVPSSSKFIHHKFDCCVTSWSFVPQVNLARNQLNK